LNSLIKQGIEVSVAKNADGSLNLNIKGRDGKNALLGTVEANTDKIKIVTAKNEPYKLTAGQLDLASDGNLDISDQNFGGKILEWRNNEWEADKILFLATGTQRFFKNKYGLPTGTPDGTFSGNFFTVLVSVPENTNDQVFFNFEMEPTLGGN
jgi:hypothetical protein